jgi:hypothetical protein
MKVNRPKLGLIAICGSLLMQQRKDRRCLKCQVVGWFIVIRLGILRCFGGAPAFEVNH